MSDARLRGFCEALHVNQTDKLMTGTVGDFRALGTRMHERIVALKAQSNEAHHRIAELERKLGEARERELRIAMRFGYLRRAS